jgi:hypothetical protein
MEAPRWPLTRCGAPSQALKAEAARQRGGAGAGASVLGYDDALRVLHPFLRRWRAARGAHPGLKAYIVAADISKAFDTGREQAQPLDTGREQAQPAVRGRGHITQAGVRRHTVPTSSSRPCRAAASAWCLDYGLRPLCRPLRPVDIQRLLEVVEPLLASPTYTLVRYCEASPALGGVRVRHAAAAVPCEPAAFPGFPEWLRTACRTGCSTVYSDQLPYRGLGRADALALLREHLTRHLLRIRGRWYRQTCGIAQVSGQAGRREAGRGAMTQHVC